MKNKKIIIIAATLISVVFLSTIGIIIHNSSKKGSIPEHSYCADIAIGNLSPEEAAKKIEIKLLDMEENGLLLRYGEKTATLPSLKTAFDADMSSQFFHYDRERIMSELEKFAATSAWKRTWLKIGLSKKEKIEVNFFLDEERIKSFILENFPDSINPAKDAAFVFQGEKISISQESMGKKIDWTSLFADLNQRLISFDNSEIRIRTETEYPRIYAKDIIGLEQEAKKISGEEIKLLFKDRIFIVTQEDLASWLAVDRNEGGATSLRLDKDRIASYLAKKISPEINKAAEDPRFEIEGGRIKNWQLGKDGYELDAEASAEAIISAGEKKETELIVKNITPASADSFDIKEIIGTGHSNFAGSPKNRRENIKVGSNAVHGIIIKAGEEFSLVKTLGDIDAEAGYLPELVIKDNKTIPEYGGGLCQIGTTIFRAALSSGLPITARRNHSYRVSYYEPAGTDAAIYDPWPDVRFLNDTGKDILIQSRIEGNDIYFDFWGTKDGRQASTTVPVVYNIVKPAPTKIIESEDLSPGEKKCTEKAHNGADAYFDYTVIYPEGATSTPLEKKKRFSSHYVPWQEVCLIGKEIATSSTLIENSSSTPTDIKKTTE